MERLRTELDRESGGDAFHALRGAPSPGHETPGCREVVGKLRVRERKVPVQVSADGVIAVAPIALPDATRRDALAGGSNGTAMKGARHSSRMPKSR